MREAERREAAATEYANSLEQRRMDQDRFQKVDSDYTKKFEDNIKTGMDSAQNELARAIESGDAAAQVQANKRIATLAFDNAKLEQRKESMLPRKNLYSFLTVDNYLNRHQDKCLKQIQWLKIGQVKTHGLDETDL